jgi:putative serine protease PepD
MARKTLSLAAAVAAAAVATGIAFAFSQSNASSSARLQTAASLETSFERVVKRVSPQVVQIQTSSGLGSGIVFDAKGDIVTNAHVTAGAHRFTVTYANGQQKSGTLVGSFQADDLAVIHVSGAPSIAPAHFANSRTVKVGEIVLAIGNPLGLRSSVTQGIVSAVGRTVSEGNGVTLPSVIQTSAPINPGNSGGALVDLVGRVIGIPTLAATDPELGGAAAGIGFAIPSNTITDIAKQLVANGHVVNSHRAYLGIRVGDTLNASGVYVGDVTAGGPAAKAGMKVGDLITSVAGKPTRTTDDLSTVLAGLKPGRTVKVGVTRQDGSKTTLSVKLGTYPGS